MQNEKLIFEEECCAIRGAVYEVCHDKIIVEIKAVDELSKEHRAQILNYLRLTKTRLGLLVNFGSYPKAAVERWAN